jgi:Holliday junction resolvase RusA-like endonuclease
MASQEAINESRKLRDWLASNRGAASDVVRWMEEHGWESTRYRIHNAARGERRLTPQEAEAVVAVSGGQLTMADLRVLGHQPAVTGPIRETWRISLKPRGKAVRSVRRGTKGGVDITAATRTWEKDAAAQIRAQASPGFLALAGGGAHEAPGDFGVRLRVIAVFSGTRKAWEPHAVKPDSSNILKSVEDAATKAGVWYDDKIVVDSRCQKWRAPKGVEPCVMVEASLVPIEPADRAPHAYLDLLAAWEAADL